MWATRATSGNTCRRWPKHGFCLSVEPGKPAYNRDPWWSSELPRHPIGSSRSLLERSFKGDSDPNVSLWEMTQRSGSYGDVRVEGAVPSFSISISVQESPLRVFPSNIDILDNFGPQHVRFGQTIYRLEHHVQHLWIGGEAHTSESADETFWKSHRGFTGERNHYPHSYSAHFGQVEVCQAGWVCLCAHSGTIIQP